MTTILTPAPSEPSAVTRADEAGRARVVRWLGWILAWALVGVACGAPDRSGWAEEARVWHDSLRELQLAQGGAAFEYFLSPEVVWDDSAIYAAEAETFPAVGANAIHRAERLLGPESLAMDRTIFIDTGGLVGFFFYDWAPLGNDGLPDTKAPAHGVARFTAIGPRGAESLVQAMAMGDWRDRHPGWPQNDEAETVATSWTEVWSRTPDRAEELYHADARVRDTIGRVDVTGSAAIGELAARGGAWGIARVGQDAVLGLYPLIRATPAGRVLQELVLVVSGQDGAGCTGEMLVWLTLDDGLVATETRYWPIERARDCLPGDDLPSGWWTEQPPLPPGATSLRFEDLENPTDPLVVGDASITIYNGTPALNQLLAWGLDRFDAAGLTPPTIASVIYTRFSDRCDDVRGWYRATSEGAELAFCFDEDVACRNDGCTSFTPASRSLVLHELAHAWMNETLDEEVRARFRNHVGLEVWNDHALPWRERAVEHAADTIAWGLMDREIAMFRLDIPSPSADHLTTGFRLLTGSDPLPRTDQG